MKTPRVQDFDPNAKPPPSLKSSMDHFPVIQKHHAPHTDEIFTKEISVLPQHPPAPPYPVRDGVPLTPVLPKRRKMRQRHPFDIYEDQYQTLKQIAEEERERGLPGSMSAMVRKGIDMYLEARKQGKI